MSEALIFLLIPGYAIAVSIPELVAILKAILTNPDLVAALTLIFTVIVYWIERTLKRLANRREYNKIVAQLEFGFKRLYDVVNADIIKYHDVKASNYFKSFGPSVYSFPIFRYLVAKNRIYDFFSEDNQYLQAMRLYEMLNLLEDMNQDGFYPPIVPHAIDWFFNNRLCHLRAIIKILNKESKYFDEDKMMEDKIKKIIN